MITVTYDQLFQASYHGSLGRLLSAPKPIAIALKNRHLPTAVDKELKAFYELRGTLLKQFGEKQEALFASTEWKELLVNKVELPAEQVPIGLLSEGKLSETDLQLLEPFIKFED